MSDVKELKILLAYHEQCKDLTMTEAIQYLCMYIEEEKLYGKFSSNCEQKVKKILFKEKYGSNSIPPRMALLMCGGYPNFDGMTQEEKDEIKVFNDRWDTMFVGN